VGSHETPTKHGCKGARLVGRGATPVNPIPKFFESTHAAKPRLNLLNPQPRQLPHQPHRLHAHRHHLPHQPHIYSGSSSRFGSFTIPTVCRSKPVTGPPPIPARSGSPAGTHTPPPESRSTSETRYTATAIYPSTAPSSPRANQRARLPPLQRIFLLLFIFRCAASSAPRQSPQSAETQEPSESVATPASDSPHTAFGTPDDATARMCSEKYRAW